MTPCAVCQTPHRNAVYCSYACRNRGEWRRNTAAGLAHSRKMRGRQFALQMARMIARVKVLGRTEDERLQLAWRYGLGASKHRRYRAKQRAA